jgi:endoglucanase
MTMDRSRRLLRFTLIALFALIMIGVVQPPFAADAQTTPGVSDARFARLRQGVNLAFSFWCDQSCINFTRFNSQLPQIAAAGFTHVRLPITFTFIENGSGGINMTTAAALKTFLDQARAANLAVIVDVHDTGIEDSWGGDYMAKIANASFRTRHLNFWRAFAGWLNTNSNPEWVFIQPANEPIFWETPSIWYNHQTQLLPIIRAAAPNHTIFVIPHEWQGIEALVWGLQRPVADRNVIYDVHYYAPLGFTHQCQAFTGTENDCDNAYPGTYPIWDNSMVYFDRARLRRDIQLAADWARTHNVRLHMSEWGVSIGAPADSRNRYFADMRSVLSEFNIGFSVWEWADNFGISTSPSAIAALTGGGTTPTPTPTTRPTATPTATPMPQATQVSGTIRIDGRSNHAMPIAVTVFRNNAQIASFSTTSSSSGTFSITLTGVSAGAARIVVKPQSALGVGRDVTLVGGAMTIDFGSTSPGDLNNDNAVSLSDFSMFANSFNTMPGQPRYDARADLNADNTVSLPDFSLLSSNFNETGVNR